MPERPTFLDNLFKITQIATPIFVGLLMPWGSWITYKVIALDEWKNQGPRFTQKDADNLKYEMRIYSTEQLTARMEVIDKQFRQVFDNLQEVKILLREHVNATPFKGGFLSQTNTYGVILTPANSKEN